MGSARVGHCRPFIERVAEADALDIRAEKVATNRKTTKLKKLSWKEPKILWAESPEHDGTQLYKLEAATPRSKTGKTPTMPLGLLRLSECWVLRST